MSTEPITLTAEQVISLVGHGATQEQLDSVRRELHTEIKGSETRLDARIDKLDSKIDTNLKWMIGMWLTTLVSIGLAVMKLLPHS